MEQLPSTYSNILCHQIRQILKKSKHEQIKPKTTSVLKLAKTFLQQEGISETENVKSPEQSATKLAQLQCNNYIRNNSKRLKKEWSNNKKTKFTKQILDEHDTDKSQPNG